MHVCVYTHTHTHTHTHSIVMTVEPRDFAQTITITKLALHWYSVCNHRCTDIGERENVTL